MACGGADTDTARETIARAIAAIEGAAPALAFPDAMAALDARIHLNCVLVILRRQLRPAVSPHEGDVPLGELWA